MRKDSVRYLKDFIDATIKKYGKKALDFRVEVHSQFVVDGAEYWGPNELETVAIAHYKADKANKQPAEKVLVIR